MLNTRNLSVELSNYPNLRAFLTAAANPATPIAAFFGLLRAANNELANLPATRALFLRAGTYSKLLAEAEMQGPLPQTAKLLIGNPS